MLLQANFRIAISLIACLLLQTDGADQYTDEKRPYEFGFNVEVNGTKQQHRHEKKDKDGLIMGEFGFVTADDVYHVTVYATDKDGRFKILSMKNIHLKSAPAPAGPQTARQGHSLALPAAPATPSPQLTTTPKKYSLVSPIKSCAACSILTKDPPQNEQQYPASVSELSNNVQQQNAYNNQPAYPQAAQPAYPQRELVAPAVSPSYAQQPQQPQQNYPGSASNSPVPNNYAQPQHIHPVSPNLLQDPNNYAQPGYAPPAEQSSVPQNYPDDVPIGNSQPSGPQFNNPSPAQNTYPQSGFSDRTSKQYTGPPPQYDSNSPTKPTLVSAQMQIVDQNTDIHALRPGEKQGLPDGLSKDDMTQLLYTFNYTVGFHGHFEEGYRNGAKKGYYFVTGRNGIKTRIDYTADDTGFHPKISQEVLDLISDDVPKPETEKEEKYGLKGYEFKWLYYPVGS